MAKLGILCGFSMNNFEEFEQKVGKVLAEYGKEAVFDVRITKARIKEYVETNRDCDVVILQERIGNKKWTAEEVAQLTEQRDVNVIIVLSERYIGKAYMETLLVANITNAIFQKGRNGGASARDIAELIVNKRSRKDARAYYGIANQRIDLGFLDEDAYVEYYTQLHQEGNSLLQNYINCCAKMSPQQIADFTRRLPENELDELAQYQEFHAVLQLLKEFKIKCEVKVKKPKRMVIGLTVPQKITFKGYENEDEMEKEADMSTEEKENEVKEVNISDSAIEEMSAADILACISGEYVPDSVVDAGKEEEAEEKESVTEEIEQPDVSSASDKEEKNTTTVSVAVEDIERAKEEARKEVQQEYESRIRDVYEERDKALKKQEQRMLEKQFNVLLEQEKDHTRESVAYEKEIKKLKNKLEKYGDDDLILDAGEKQFSWGVFVVLGLLVAAAVAAVYFKADIMALLPV